MSKTPSRVERSLETERKRLEARLVVERGRVADIEAALERIEEALAALRGKK